MSRDRQPWTAFRRRHEGRVRGSKPQVALSGECKRSGVGLATESLTFYINDLGFRQRQAMSEARRPWGRRRHRSPLSDSAARASSEVKFTAGEEIVTPNRASTATRRFSHLICGGPDFRLRMLLRCTSCSGLASSARACFGTWSAPVLIALQHTFSGQHPRGSHATVAEA